MIKTNQTWQDNVQNLYSSIIELESYDSIYGIVRRCGYSDLTKFWNDNPKIGGSVNPQDFGLAIDN